MKNQITSFGGVLGEVEYGADVRIHALLPEERAEEFCAQVTEASSGTVTAELEGETFQDVPWKAPM
jgi:hypothetical protein